MNNAGTQEVAYAGLGQRSLAAFLDNLVWLFFLGQIAANIPASTYEEAPIVVGLVFFVLFSAWFNYFWLMEWKWGKTIGKAIVSIHVTTETGERLRFGPTTVRNVLRLVDVLAIGPIMIATSARHQRLGDRLAHTVVVRDQPEPVRARASQPTAAGAGGTANPHPAAPPAAPPSLRPPAVAGAPPRPAEAGTPAQPQPRSSGSIGIPVGGWRPIHVLWGVLAAAGLAIVEAGIVSAFDPDLDSLGARLAVQALLAATLVGVAVAFALAPAPGLDLPERLGLRGFRRSAFAAAAGGYGIYFVFAVIWGLLVEPEQEDITRDLGVGDSALAAVAAGVLIVGAAPISEEVFFRGFMFGGLRRRLPLWAAAVISAAVFGALHYTGPDSIGVIPPLAVLGIVLAWLYEHTGSLWPPIMVHAVNNALAFTILTTS